MEKVIARLKENVFVNCNTKEENDKLVAFARENGFKWYDGNEFVNAWETKGKEICYNVGAGCFSCVEECKALGLEVVSYESIFGSKPRKSAK